MTQMRLDKEATVAKIKAKSFTDSEAGLESIHLLDLEDILGVDLVE